MITLKINGERHEMEVTHLSQVISQFKFSDPFYAVAINRTVVPRSEHHQIELKDGDEIEVVQAVGGG
jgi:sulfur carrier protein